MGVKVFVRNILEHQSLEAKLVHELRSVSKLRFQLLWCITVLHSASYKPMSSPDIFLYKYPLFQLVFSIQQV